MKFEEWYEKFWGALTSDHQRKASEVAWKACKQETLKILDKYSQTPAYPYIKEALEKEI